MEVELHPEVVEVSGEIAACAGGEELEDYGGGPGRDGVEVRVVRVGGEEGDE